MKKMINRSLLVAGVLALSMHNAFAAGSDFIEDMPQLTQDPDRPGAMIWQKPGVDRAACTRVMIEPVTVFISPESEYKGLNADELKVLEPEHLEIVTGLLAEAERHFWSEDIVLYLDRMNIQRDAQDRTAREIRFRELRNARGRHLLALLVVVNPSELPQRVDMITAAERYLV